MPWRGSSRTERRASPPWLTPGAARHFLVWRPTPFTPGGGPPRRPRSRARPGPDCVRNGPRPAPLGRKGRDGTRPPPRRQTGRGGRGSGYAFPAAGLARPHVDGPRVGRRPPAVADTECCDYRNCGAGPPSARGVARVMSRLSPAPVLDLSEARHDVSWLVVVRLAQVSAHPDHPRERKDLQLPPAPVDAPAEDHEQALKHRLRLNHLAPAWPTSRRPARTGRDLRWPSRSC